MIIIFCKPWVASLIRKESSLTMRWYGDAITVGNTQVQRQTIGLLGLLFVAAGFVTNTCIPHCVQYTLLVQVEFPSDPIEGISR